jgi:hypothetical protein
MQNMLACEAPRGDLTASYWPLLVEGSKAAIAMRSRRTESQWRLTSQRLDLRILWPLLQLSRFEQIMGLQLGVQSSVLF